METIVFEGPTAAADWNAWLLEEAPQGKVRETTAIAASQQDGVPRFQIDFRFKDAQ